MERTAYVIYNRFEAVRNRWFIDRLTEECTGFGTSLLLLEEEELSAPGEGGAVRRNGSPLEKPCFVIMRAGDYRLSAAFEKSGVRVFNSARVSLVANDKAASYKLATDLGLPFMETRLISSAADGLFYPAVIKPTDGKGGKNVMLVESREELEGRIPLFEGKPFLFQRVVGDRGRDLRVYLMGGRVLTAFMRSSDSDFRSNFCLGGRAKEYTVGAKELEMTMKLAEALSPDFVGVDFIYDNGEPYFNEIEDAVGCRMVYANTDINVAGEYVRYIFSRL